MGRSATGLSFLLTIDYFLSAEKGNIFYPDIEIQHQKCGQGDPGVPGPIGPQGPQGEPGIQGYTTGATGAAGSAETVTPAIVKQTYD